MSIRPKTSHARAFFHGMLISSLIVAGLAMPAWAADRKPVIKPASKVGKVVIKSIGLLPPPRPASPHK